MASLADISAMKIAAISERGTKRDFVDLYFILQKVPLSQVLTFYDKKYKKLASNLVHIRKSLVYFDDAEEEAMPKMLEKVSWPKIKKFFEKEIQKISQKLLK